TLVTAAGSRSRAAISATEAGRRHRPRTCLWSGSRLLLCGPSPVATTMDTRFSLRLAVGPPLGTPDGRAHRAAPPPHPALSRAPPPPPPRTGRFPRAPADPCIVVPDCRTGVARNGRTLLTS